MSEFWAMCNPREKVILVLWAIGALLLIQALFRKEKRI